MNDVTKQNIISKINKIVGTIYREHNQQMYKLKTEMNKKTNGKKFLKFKNKQMRNFLKLKNRQKKKQSVIIPN